jgi:hypothetical protein
MGAVEESPTIGVDGWSHCPGVPKGSILRFRVPGYFPKEFDPSAAGTRTVLPMDPGAACLRGEILVPDLPEGTAVEFSILRDGESETRRLSDLRGVPEAPGAFRVEGVPEGEWVLHVSVDRSRQGHGRRDLWARRRFRSGPAGADLGAIRLEPGATLEARLIEADGRISEEAAMEVLDPAVFAGRPPIALGYGMRGSGRRGYGLSLHSRDGGMGAWNGPFPGPGEDGWTRFHGIRPGAEVVLVSLKHPGLYRQARLPDSGKVQVELDARVPRTDCVLRFTIGGEEPAFWVGLLAGPAFADDFSTGKGTLTAAIPPGRHRFVVMATMEADGPRASFAADAEIPDSGKHETTIDLAPLR